MPGVTYQVFFFDLSAVDPAAPPVQIWPKGRTLRLLEVSLISPVTQPVGLIFGSANQPIPTEHGRSYGDDDTVQYDDGVWFSLPVAASPGSVLTITIYQ